LQDSTPKKKSRIAVNTQDIEEVIRVGAQTQPVGEGESVVDAVRSEVAAEVDAQVEQAAASGAQVASGGESVAVESSASAAPSPSAKVTGTKRGAEKAYRETTLEDIESSKMSTMQKVIIAVAAVALIAFAIWYFAF
jgi:cobalamin biosynthesis Mg chelatase CobN